MEEKNENELRAELWGLFCKLPDDEKVEWLMEFDIISETIWNWETETLEEEIERLRESAKNE